MSTRRSVIGRGDRPCSTRHARLPLFQYAQPTCPRAPAATPTAVTSRRWSLLFLCECRVLCVELFLVVPGIRTAVVLVVFPSVHHTGARRPLWEALATAVEAFASAAQRPPVARLVQQPYRQIRRQRRPTTNKIFRPSRAAAQRPRRCSHPPRAKQGPLLAARGATRKRRQFPCGTCALTVALPVGGERLPPRGVEGGA